MKKLAILIAAIALVAFTVPAMAADWNFYGSARMATYYTSDYNGTTNSDGLQWKGQPNSRIGAKVKADKLKGQFEYGYSSQRLGSHEHVRLRRLYGEWKFADGMRLKVGRDYTPISQFLSGQVGVEDNGFVGMGLLYGFREDQIALSFGGFTIAALTQSNNTRFYGGGGNPTYGGGSNRNYLPKFEASYYKSFDTWNFGLQGGFNYYSVKDAIRTTGSKAGKEEDIAVTSYLLGATTGFNFGPAYVKAGAYYGVNAGNCGWLTTFSGNGSAVWDGKSDSVDDNEALGGALILGMAVSDMLRFEGGVGYAHQSPDGGKTSDTYNWYAQSVITLAPGVHLIPEVGYWDAGTSVTGTKQGNHFYAGGKWQIDF